MSDFTVHVPGLPPLPLARQRAELVLGRNPDLAAVLGDPTISWRHARFTWREGSAWLEDLGSRHGTFRNGRRLQAAEAVQPGDRITLGRFEVRLEVAREPGDLSAEETPLSLSLDDLRRWGSAEPPQSLDLLHEVSLLLLRDQPPEALLALILERLFSFLDAGRGAVLLPGEDGVLAPMKVLTREPRGEGPLGLPRATLEATLNRRVAMLFREPGGAGDPARTAESSTTSMMAVPLEHEGRVLGILYFDALGGRAAFSEAELRLVATLGNLAAARILAQRLRDDLSRKEAAEREVREREAAARAREAFLARVSHELRTPMNAVLGFAHLALEEPLPPRAEAFLGKILKAGERLLGVVGDILDFSRLGSGSLVLEEAPFDLRAEVRSVLDAFGPACQEKGLDLALDFPGEPPAWVLGDPLRLGQVLTNLVGNAVKFTERGSVRVEVAGLGPRGGRFRLAFKVSDTGLGIPPEAAERIFSPFEQAGPGTARRFGGTGLGLPIARELVERMGGTLDLASEPGRGSTFSFTLDLPPAAAPSAAEAPAPPPDLAGRRLLLADDNPLNLELASAILQGAGATVTVAWDGLEVLAQLEQAEFDAILLDLHMPHLDGNETARRIRASGRTLPLIGMTAGSGPGHPLLEAGMDEVLTKPIKPRKLLETVARRLGMEPPPAPAPLRPPALEALAPLLDLEAALARVDGRGDLLLAFLRGFLEEPVDLEGPLSRGDLPGARRAAHDLGGSALTLGQEELAARAFHLEEQLAAGGPWEAAWAELGAVLGPFLAAAQKVLAEAGEPLG